MKVSFEVAYDQGTASLKEDEEITNFPFFGVIDGVSGIYHPNDGPMMFSGMSGGQMVCHEIQLAVLNAKKTNTVLEVIEEASRVVRHRTKKKGIPFDHTELMPGASFVLAKIGADETEIIQSGDCFAIVLFSAGEIVVTPNKLYKHDALLHEAVEKLMLKHRRDRVKMWQEFIPIFSAMKRRHTNNPSLAEGFGLLNGQDALQKLLWKHEFATKSISTMVFFSDGFVPFEKTVCEKRLGKRFLEVYAEEGLTGILERTRRAEKEKRAKSHIDHSEATAIVVKISH